MPKEKCKICGREDRMSEEFPDWCESCVEKYADSYDEEGE